MRRIMLPAVIAICLGLTGCAMFRVSIKDKEAGETGPLSAKYDPVSYTHLRAHET